MKRFHEYENEFLETYYALGKGNKFLVAVCVTGGEHCVSKDSKDANVFNTYVGAKRWAEQHSKYLEGFKIYAITHCVRTETQDTVLDCNVFKETQRGIRVNGVVQPTGKFDKEGKRA